MKFFRGTLIALLGLVAGFLLVWGAMPSQAQGAAPAPGKPALYDFGRGMCIPCKEMEKVLSAVKSEYGDQVEVRLVLLEKNEDMFKQYKITAVPTQVFLNAEGKEVDRHIGASSKEEVVAKLKALKFITK
jgi:thioredoxin 1